MRKAAALCEAFGMSWEPHAYGGTLYQTANLSVQLATRNTLLFELPIEAGAEGHFDTGTTEVLRIDPDGFVPRPEAPRPGPAYRLGPGVSRNRTGNLTRARHIPRCGASAGDRGRACRTNPPASRC